MNRNQAPALVAVVLGAALASGCGPAAPEAVQSEAVVPVVTEPAVIGTIRGAIHATGMVTPAPGAELTVVAPEAARIAEIPRGEGETVRRGDVLVRFEIPSLPADVQRQGAELRRAQAGVATAQAALVRARDLFDRGVAARREVEEAERQVADAQAAVEQATASQGVAEAMASRAVVRASFDGVVAHRYHNPGDLVESAAGDPVLRVVDLRRLEVVAAVPLAQVWRVTPGAHARLTSASAGPSDVELTVVSRPASVEAGTATVSVRLAFSGPTRLPVFAPVEVAIDAEEHTGVLVPSEAVLREGEETAVFVAAGTTAERRLVHVGLSDDTHVEIASGVEAGELVVVEGQAGLPDGATIAATPAPPSAREGAPDPTAAKGPTR
ncbi:MAG: efflux RND transporter periplasmic adaptor subunit [Acidobacteriota bacterium]|nr:efflux RND transporter periplasmic adaptor subunit [Acidobacteriota bacterium]